jgi:hypothetical protein
MLLTLKMNLLLKMDYTSRGVGAAAAPRRGVEVPPAAASRREMGPTTATMQQLRSLAGASLMPPPSQPISVSPYPSRAE